MGTSPDSPPENPKKNDVVMGYPNQTQQMYAPPPPPATGPLYEAPSDPKPKGSEPTSSSTPYQQYPNPYAQSPYQPYPSAYQPYPSPYQQMNPAPYSYNDYYYQQHIRQESESSGSFGRVLLILMLLLVSSILMMSLIMWFLFGASVPEFHVEAIKVSNFTATNTSWSGTWSVQMWVTNVNMELDVHFQRGMSSIFYKDSMLGVAALEPFDVRKTQRFGLNLTVPALQDQSWIPPTLAVDRSDGVVVVSLRLAVDANFTAPNADYRQERLRILCEDLPISFSSTSGEGTLPPSLGSNCFIRLREGHD